MFRSATGWYLMYFPAWNRYAEYPSLIFKSTTFGLSKYIIWPPTFYSRFGLVDLRSWKAIIIRCETNTFSIILTIHIFSIKMIRLLLNFPFVTYFLLSFTFPNLRLTATTLDTRPSQNQTCATALHRSAPWSRRQLTKGWTSGLTCNLPFTSTVG